MRKRHEHYAGSGGTGQSDAGDVPDARFGPWDLTEMAKAVTNNLSPKELCEFQNFDSGQDTTVWFYFGNAAELASEGKLNSGGGARLHGEVKLNFISELCGILQRDIHGHASKWRVRTCPLGNGFEFYFLRISCTQREYKLITDHFPNAKKNSDEVERKIDDRRQELEIFYKRLASPTKYMRDAQTGELALRFGVLCTLRLGFDHPDLALIDGDMNVLNAAMTLMDDARDTILENTNASNQPSATSHQWDQGPAGGCDSAAAEQTAAPCEEHPTVRFP